MFVPHHVPHETSHITAEAFGEISGQHFSKNGVLGIGYEPSMCGGQAGKHMARDIENSGGGTRPTFAESEAILRY